MLQQAVVYDPADIHVWSGGFSTLAARIQAAKKASTQNHTVPNTGTLNTLYPFKADSSL